MNRKTSTFSKRLTGTIGLILFAAILLPGGSVFAVNGYSWTKLSNAPQCVALAASSTGQYVVCGTHSGDIFTSNNYGTTWTDQVGAGSDNWVSVAISDNGQYIAATNATSTSFSSNSGVTWTQPTSALRGLSMSRNGQYILGSFNTGLDKSTNFGASWSAAPDGSAHHLGPVAVSGDGQYGLLGDTAGSSLYQSFNSLQTFNANHTAALNWYNLSILSADASGTGQYQVLGTGNGDTIYTSDDFGVHWTGLTSITGGPNWVGVSISDDGQHIVAIGDSGSLYESNNAGQTMVADSGVPSNGWLALSTAANASRILAVDATGALWLGQTSSSVAAASTASAPTTSASSQSQPTASVPEAPNTGYGKPSTHPTWVELALVGASISLFILARRITAKPHM